MIRTIDIAIVTHEIDGASYSRNRNRTVGIAARSAIVVLVHPKRAGLGCCSEKRHRRWRLAACVGALRRDVHAVAVVGRATTRPDAAAAAAVITNSDRS